MFRTHLFYTEYTQILLALLIYEVEVENITLRYFLMAISIIWR